MDTFLSRSCKIALLILLTGFSRWSVAAFHRPFEPVVIRSTAFMPDFENARLDQIKLFRYDARSSLWVLIPSQIDERTNGSYFTEISEYTSILENNQYTSPDVRNANDDELVFMAADAGDLAPDEAWIGDASSRRYARFQITLIDTVTNERAYAYAFRTDAGSDDPGLQDYISYVAEADGILGQTYGYAHNLHGLFTDLSIRPEAGGAGIDLVDRLKVRVKGSGSYNGIPLGTQRLTEDNLVKGSSGPRAWAVDGRVRVIRKWNVRFYLNPIYVNISTDIIFKFYPHYCDYADLHMKTPEGINIDYARFSFDLNPSAGGMRLFSPRNPQGITTNNAVADGEPDRTIDTPAWQWWMHTGTPGTLLFVGYLPLVGAQQYMYYHDYPTGTNDPDTKFADTGYDGSWGDTGVKYYGPGITGEIPFAGRQYFLGPNLSPDSAAAIAKMASSPLKVQVSMNITVPVELAAFTAKSREDQVVLNWQTATETNNLGFVVERKRSSSDWLNVGYVKGHGTVVSPHQYSFAESELGLGRYEYRLKQLDSDGSFHYSPVVAVEVTAPKEMALQQNYPNPFNPRTTIPLRIPGTVKDGVSLTIYDMLGRKVRTLLTGAVQPGYHKIEWDGLDEYGRATSSGVYISVLTDGERRWLKKLIKVQ